VHTHLFAYVITRAVSLFSFSFFLSHWVWVGVFVCMYVCMIVCVCVCVCVCEKYSSVVDNNKHSATDRGVNRQGSQCEGDSPTDKPSIPRRLVRWMASWSWITWVKLIVLVILLATIIVCVAVFHSQIQHGLVDFLNWIQGLGAWGPVLLVLIYIVACVFFIPVGLTLMCCM
jgi:hypothetical protein